MTRTGPAFLASVITGAAPEQRAAVCEAINGLDPETREEEIRAAVEAHEDEARKPQRTDADVIALRNRAAALTFGTGTLDATEPSWRALMPSKSEWRTVANEGIPGEGGYTVPTKVAKDLRDRVRQASVFMRIAGLNVVEMDSAQLVLPTLSTSNAGAKTAEKTAITEATLAFTGPTLAAVGYKGLVVASNEVLADSAVSLRDRIGRIIAADIAEAADTDLLSTTAAAGGIAGLLHTSKSTNTVLAAGNPTVKFDAVLDAVARIEAANLLVGKLTIIAAPDAAAALRKEKASGSGEYLGGGVLDALTTSAFGADILVSPKVASGKVVVVAGDYVTIGIRQDVLLAVSEDYGFANDTVGFRGTMRIAGVDTQDAKAVQVITPTP
jgi:HK97 family phage major capsid protein